MVHEVRRAHSREVDELSRALGRAFQEDPIFSWLIPDRARRRAVLEPGFHVLLRRAWLAQEETYTDAEVGGASVWHRPGAWKLGLLEQLTLLPALARVWGRHGPRALRALVATERKHPQEPHYYLACLGVQPESQGRGMGSSLMFPILQRCDEKQVPAYLESSSPRSRALYERHGFEVSEEFRFAAEAPPLWLMWREPQ
jgi:ribosomal protein S18 acetylase RimI-like enzyme